MIVSVDVVSLSLSLFSFKRGPLSFVAFRVIVGIFLLLILGDHMAEELGVVRIRPCSLALKSNKTAL